MIDILYIANRVQHFEYDLGDQIKTFRRSERIGELTNGKSFKLAIHEPTGQWLERLRGIEFGEFRELDGVRISPRERLALQAMIQR